jgi:nucleoside-diphosphate-sugar epimerase
MSPKRILLLGASKHIGFHVVEYLAPQPEKYSLFVLARSSASTIAEFEGKENVTFIQGDAKDENVVSNAIHSTMNGQVDFVIVTVGIDSHFSYVLIIGGALVFNKFLMPRISDPTLWY